MDLNDSALSTSKNELEYKLRYINNTTSSYNFKCEQCNNTFLKSFLQYSGENNPEESWTIPIQFWYELQVRWFVKSLLI